MRTHSIVLDIVDSRRLKVSVAIVAVILLSTGSVPGAFAQMQDSLSADASVSLLTIFPGDSISSAFGHSTYRFYDPASGYDVVFNYGTFEFQNLFFIPRFMYGILDYYLHVGYTTDLLRAAVDSQRSVIEQRLQLSPAQVRNLYQTLRINARPENRTYRYDFLFDNCATILLDRIQSISGAQIRLDSTNTPQETFRELLQPYLNDRAFYDLGIAIVLGSTLDERSTYEERSFLPLELMEAFEQARILAPQGEDDSARSVSLVSRTDTLYWAPGTGPAKQQDLSLLWFFGLLSLLWIGMDLRRLRKAGQKSFIAALKFDSSSAVVRADRLLFGIAGIAGLIISFVWFISVHTVGAANWNILWALPTHILPAIFWNRIRVDWKRWYFRVSAVAAFSLLALQPVLAQKLHPALLPVVFLIGWRSIMISLRDPGRDGFVEVDTEVTADINNSS